MGLVPHRTYANKEAARKKMFIPKTFLFNTDVLKDKSFKLLTKGERTMLCVKPLVRTALMSMTRGRISHNIESSAMPLARMMSTKLDTNVKGIIKDAANRAHIQDIKGEQWIVLDIHLIKFDDGTMEICNPHYLK